MLSCPRLERSLVALARLMTYESANLNVRPSWLQLTMRDRLRPR